MIINRKEDITIFYVYGYIDPESCDPYFYLGKGHGNRAWDHLYYFNSIQGKDYDYPFYRKLRQMEEIEIEPIIEIIKDELLESQAFELEIELIAKYGRRNNGTGCLLNLTNGGEGSSGNLGGIGRESTLETKIKMSMSASKRMLTCRANLTLGLRKKMGKPVRAFNLITRETVKRYECLADVELDNFQRRCVSKCCQGKSPSHLGLGWEYD